MLKILALSIFMSDRADKFKEGVTRYEPHPPSLRTVYFPTAPFVHITHNTYQNPDRYLHIVSIVQLPYLFAHHVFLL